MNATRTIMRTAAASGTAVLAAAALGACGGAAGENGSAKNPRDAAQEGALKFARCMRGEGLDFPDPQVSANGMIRVRRQGPGPGPAASAGERVGRLNDPRFQAAMQKCRKHLRFGGGERPSPAQQAKFRDAFLKFARCMRANGINVPDPRPGGGAGFVMRVGGPGRSGINPDSPKFQAAERKCRPLLAEVDREIGGPR